MLHDHKLSDEAARLAAVERYVILDTPPEPEFERLAELLKQIFQAPLVVISLIDDRRQWYKARVGIDAWEISRELAFCDYTVRQRDVMVVEDAREDPRFAGHPLVIGEPHIRSYLGAPLTSPDGYNVGTICIVDMKPRRFSDNEIEMLAKFADVVVSQFELRRIASRDGLTGALTRRAFEDAAAKELARFSRHGAPAALALFDLDHFKTVNDRYGHGIGDAVLRRAVEACHDIMREEEVLGRIGGEEFALLFVNTDGTAAVQAAERFREAIEAARIREVPDLAFTASFGVADCRPEVSTVADWLERADRALYEAKGAGRNRTARAGTL